MHRFKNLTALSATMVFVAACAAPAPPPPPPAAAPVVFAPPRAPLPPLGASASFVVPAVGTDGKRLTVNRGIGELETLWHFRAAFNVGGLSCQDTGFLSIADDYNAFLQKHKSALNRANNAIEAKYRREHGRDYRRVRDTRSTQVYNFFSFPPVKQEFCSTVQRLGQEALAIEGRDNLSAFAATALPQLEAIYDRFYTEYEAYQAALADWQARYGSNAGGAGTNAAPQPSNPQTTGTDGTGG